jgi:hypothetical protein
MSNISVILPVHTLCANEQIKKNAGGFLTWTCLTQEISRGGQPVRHLDCKLDTLTALSVRLGMVAP